MAYAVTCGYELDLTELTGEQVLEIRSQVAFYKKLEPLILFGDYYRLSPAYPDREYAAWAFLSRDKSECLFEYVRIYSRGNRKPDVVCLQGLDAAAVYRDEAGNTYSGALLMNHGIPCRSEKGDYTSFVCYLKRI